MASRNIVIFALCVFLITFNTSTKAEYNLFFAAIPIELDTDQRLPLSDKISLVFNTAYGDEVFEQITTIQNLSTERSSENSLALRFLNQHTLPGAPEERHSSRSFVIDIEEASTKSFVSGFISTGNKSADLARITSYTHHYIKIPTYIHGFNIASKVASTRSGDCTEYAVLTTALSRALDYPARLIIGTAILEDNLRIQAFGHAWTEIWYEDHWQIVDAALYDSKTPFRVRYLPTFEMENEGTGYKFELFKATQTLPVKLTEVRNIE